MDRASDLMELPDADQTRRLAQLAEFQQKRGELNYAIALTNPSQSTAMFEYV